MAGVNSKYGSSNITPTGMDYETVAASQTAQVLGPTGALGDHIARLISYLLLRLRVTFFCWIMLRVSLSLPVVLLLCLT